jgi:polyphosphate kinase
MSEAGIEIIFSIPEIKVHSKIALVRKNEGGEQRSYSILSTGNFNEITAKFYTDHTLLTTDKAINEELLLLFDFLKKRTAASGQHLKFNRIYVSQFNMIDAFEKLVNREIKKAAKGKAGRIRIKLNNLEEEYMIALLYKASEAGVKVEMIVRSICCLVPGVPEQSSNIEIRRIVDRYLEHTRLFIFGDDDDFSLVIGSSDWMTRNLRRRIEVCANIEDPVCRMELLDYFKIQWNDNTKAVRIGSDMQQQPVTITGDEHNAQKEIYAYLQQRK